MVSSIVWSLCLFLTQASLHSKLPARSLRTPFERLVRCARVEFLNNPRKLRHFATGDEALRKNSALERIKRAKEYQRVNKGQSSSASDEIEIQEIEKRDAGEAAGSQFSNIKTTLEHMRALDERGHKNDRKVFELLKKFGIPSPEPFQDTSELHFPSNEIREAK
mmetsp:Transcript_27070/g.37685  ORF Transcript_27070/g.37685 Transcript_27070/m.37685 type:complete len:164 (+) Transcript_27070:158-649(+)